MAKKMLLELPYLVQTQILNKCPMGSIIELFDDDSDVRQSAAVLEKFECFCRTNNIQPTLGRHTQWVELSKKFLSSLKGGDRYKPKCIGPGHWMCPTSTYFDRNDMVVTGERFEYWAVTCVVGDIPERIVMNFTLKRPQRQRKNLPRKTYVLEEEHTIGTTATFNYILGNAHDLKVQEDEPINTYFTTLVIEHPSPIIVFDENDVLYYVNQSDESLTVFRKSLESHDPPTPIYAIDKTYVNVELSVDHGRLWLLVDAGEPRLHFYNMNTHQTLEVGGRFRVEPNMLIAHEDSAMLIGGCVSWIFTATENGFQKMPLPGILKLRLNRHTYVWSHYPQDHKQKVKAYTTSFINGRMGIKFLTDCDISSEFEKDKKSILHIIEPKRKRTWYEQNPGDHLQLLFMEWRHEGATRVPITTRNESKKNNRKRRR